VTGVRERTVTLEESYAACRALNRKHGVTYYWSTMLLPPVKRHHVHALYAFARVADDIVDDLGERATVEERAAALAHFGGCLMADLDRGASDDPVLRAVVHTVRAFDIERDTFCRFLRSMTMDLTIGSYDTWDDLLGYVDGSAAVIGEMMLPILEPPDPAAALPHARDLGIAFQLTNFLRDIGEDLDRGREYLPQEDLRRFGVELDERRCSKAFQALMQFEIARCRDLYASADLGIAMLPPSSARCVRAARDLYSRILDRIEALDYDVFTTRASVPATTKAAVIARLVRR